MIRTVWLGVALGGLLVCSACATAPRFDRIPPAPTGHANSVAERLPPTTAAATATPAAPERPAKQAPDYDLDADLDARRVEATADLGRRTDLELVEGTFLIAAPGGRAGLGAAIDVSERALGAYFNGRFTRHPERAISVYLFPNAAPYEAYCKRRWSAACDSPYGFYLHDERRIVMNVGLGIGTLTHELVHPLVAVDFPNAPDWINEGIASLFEQFYFTGKGEIHGGKNWRYPRLARALRSNDERDSASLPALFALSDREFRGDREALNYAAARYFCQWLDQRGKLWPFYRLWRDHFSSDPTGEQSLLEILGKTPSDANAEWSAWVRRL